MASEVGSCSPPWLCVNLLKRCELHSHENGGVNIWLQCFMEPECQIVILCKEISMIFPLEIKSLFRPPLHVAFLMSNKTAAQAEGGGGCSLSFRCTPPPF